MARRKAGASRAAATGVASSTASPSVGHMVFESEDFRRIPSGVAQVIFKIGEAGDDQSVSLGAGLFEQLKKNAQWIVIDKKRIDNLPTTPEESFFAFVPKPGASYAITFLGEVHSLSLRKDPLSVELLITADGIGEPLEDFGGKRTLDARFCIARGRALLKADV